MNAMTRTHLGSFFVYEISAGECWLTVVGKKCSFSYSDEQNWQQGPPDGIAVEKDFRDEF
jgi:hypothetical protein